MGTVYRRKPKGNFYGEFTGANGKRVRRSTGTSNKSDAARIVAKWENEANNLSHGIVSPSKLALDEVLVEYMTYLGNKSDDYRQTTERRLRKIADLNGWESCRSINQFELETAVRNLKHPTTGQPSSLRTQSHYLGAWKTLTKWLVNVRKLLPSDPLAGVKKPGFQSDRKLIRRFLLPSEWRWLAQTESALLYETAIQTGFRANELRKLDPSCLSHDSLTLAAKHTKNKQPAKQYITASLAQRLQGQLPFDMSDKFKLARQLREDLAIARAAYLESLPTTAKPDPHFLIIKDARGHELDFHALRHTCGAWLAISGESPKVIQAIMRHSSIVLTLDTYGHLLPAAEQDAIKHFERLLAVDLCQTSDSH